MLRVCAIVVCLWMLIDVAPGGCGGRSRGGGRPIGPPPTVSDDQPVEPATETPAEEPSH